MRSPWVVSFLALAACQTAATPGASCERQSDCASPLVCAFGRCRAECQQNRDCPAPTHCLLVDGVNGACSLEIDTGCETGVGRTCASGLVCAADRCEGTCTADADCPRDGTCLRSSAGASFCFDARAGDAGITARDAGSDAGTDAFVPDAGPPAIGVLDVCLGANLACVIGHDRAVYCWGAGFCGAPEPTRVQGVTGADAIACGPDFACAHVAGSDHVVCWGANDVGQLGVTPSAGCTSTPTTVLDTGGSPITPPSPTHLAAARGHACALYAEGGSLMCWGEPSGLFDTTVVTAPTPARLAQIFYDLLSTTPILLSADVTPTGICVRNEEFTTRREPIIHCGGDDTHHELGLAATVVDPIPFYWSTALAVGATHRCALSADHLVSCWGGGGAGQLGVLPSTLGTCGTDACSAVGQPINDLLFASVATSGDSDTTCGVVTNASAPGQVTCWGANLDAQTGRIASPYAVVTTPTSFVTRQDGAPLTRIQRIAVGTTSACAIDDQERLYCWGRPVGVFASPPPGSPFATEVVVRGGP